MMKYFKVFMSVYIVFCLVFLAEGSLMPWDEYLRESMARARTEDTHLRLIYEQHIKAQYEIEKMSGNRKEALETLLRTPRDAAETKYILEALNYAYQKEPKDWGTVAAALEVSVAGTDEEQIVQLCKKILENIREVPDDSSDVVWGASQYLLVKREVEYVELVVNCVYAEFVGAQEESEAKHPSVCDRNQFRYKAISALRRYLPDDMLLEVFEKLSQDHPVEAAKDPLSWQHAIASTLKNIKESIELTLRDGPTIVS
jgi:hypothetical protein